MEKHGKGGQSTVSGVIARETTPPSTAPVSARLYDRTIAYAHRDIHRLGYHSRTRKEGLSDGGSHIPRFRLALDATQYRAAGVPSLFGWRDRAHWKSLGRPVCRQCQKRGSRRECTRLMDEQEWGQRSGGECVESAVRTKAEAARYIELCSIAPSSCD